MQAESQFLNNVVVIIPVFNDWESLRLLLNKMHHSLSDAHFSRLSFLIIDDGSNQPAPTLDVNFNAKVELLSLTRNVGHQKAIAIGLAHVAQNVECSAAIVMDADGEDRPEHLADLLNAHDKTGNKIIFARRTKRSEGIMFRVFYQIYKLVFKLLTGKAITFGNFSLVPKEQLNSLVHVSEIWNHYSGGVIKSRINYVTIPLERGKRLAGKSKMNFYNLVLHGLSAVAVHIDTMAVRLLVFSMVLIAVSLLSIFTVMIIKLFTPFASPGWATTVATGFASVIMQAFLVSLLLMFMSLIYRTQRLFIPALHFEDYIKCLKKFE